MFSVSLPESQVLDALARIEPLGIPFCAIHVAMSKLSADNRGYRQLEIVSHLFEPLLNHAQARLFLLSNKDFLLLTAYPVLAMIDNILEKVYALFADDIFFLNADKSSFYSVYFLDKDKDALKALLQPKQQETGKEEKKQSYFEIKEPSKTKELTADLLEKLLYQISQTSPSTFIRRQSVVHFASDVSNEEAFQEFYTSIEQLQNVFAPDVNLSSDKALFSLLLETLDVRMLSELPNLRLTHYPKAIALNMNIDTIFTPVFDQLSQSLPCSLIVEFEISDVFHRLRMYRQACEKLAQTGIKIVINGIGVNEFELLNLEPFNADYVKLLWTSKWKEQGRIDQLMHFITKNKNVNVILARCSDKESLLFGCQAGIRLFQGFFIDDLIARMAKDTCTFGQECSVKDCMVRRSVLDGDLRNQCVHQPHLDIFMPLKED